MRIKKAVSRSVEILRRESFKSLINIAWTKLYTLKMLPLYVKSYPLTVQIETTNMCNLKCSMCAHSTASWKSHIPPKMLTLEEFKYILNQLPYIRWALINGVGEPLLNPYLIDMIKYAYSKRVKTSFFTNAMLLTRDKAKELINAEGLIELRVSIDAGTADTYEKIRVGANFRKVFDNIKNFIEMRNSSGRDLPRISVFTIAMRENIDEIPLLVDLIAGLGINCLHLHGLREDDETFGEPLQSGDILLLERYKEEAAKKGVNVTFGDIDNDTPNTLRKRTCIDPWKMVYVNATGWINPCCYSFDDKSAYFGNIFETPFSEIWNNDNYRNFRHKLKTGMPAPCLRCPRYGQKR